MKKLIIAEKPSVAKDIARVLQCNQRQNGVLEGKTYIVTWALGHLVTLADPESYSEKYKVWNLESLPMLPKKLNLVVIKQTSKQYQIVKSQIQRKDVNEIIIGTDAGREGELVARWILEKANNQKPIKRLWISSVTDKAIKEGFAHLKEGKEYQNLYLAAVSRAESDWLVGINATRALTCKYNAQLSCGRVQTPTLAMIAKREEEIKNFQPKSYYGISAISNKISFTWRDKKSKGYSSFEKNRIEAILKELQGKDCIITEVSKAAKKTFSPGLYDLTELQRDANKKFNYSAKQTLNIMQRLYENHKVLTYPRTDSRYLTTDVVPTLNERLRACAIGPYSKLAKKLINTTISAKAYFVNNSKVSDHHAIIPTEQFVSLENMSSEERKIYDLVVKRFLAVLYPAFEYEQTTITAAIGNEEFIARGKIVQHIGWKEVYNNQLEEENESEADLKVQSLPNIKKAEHFSVTALAKTEGKTKPPAYFNEATLLSAMENPIKYMDTTNKAAIQTIGETGGLGTVATRADIIEKLFNSFLMEKKGKDILITSKGKQLLELVPDDLKKPEMTAELEMKLSKVAKGNLKSTVLMQEMRDYTISLVNTIKKSDGKFRHDNLTATKCPQCGKFMLSVNGKNSKMLVCQDRECGHRETISRTTNARCPVCHKKMELQGKSDSQIFICLCGYKEKLTAFQERRKREGNGISKKEITNYLKKQQKQEQPLNNAFANALSKINLE